MEDVAKLKKQLTIIRVVVFVLATLCFLFFVFAYVQKLEADKNWKEANEQRIMAEQARVEAEHQRTTSVQARDEAIVQRMQCETMAAALVECQKKNK